MLLTWFLNVIVHGICTCKITWLTCKYLSAVYRNKCGKFCLYLPCPFSLVIFILYSDFVGSMHSMHIITFCSCFVYIFMDQNCMVINQNLQMKDFFYQKISYRYLGISIACSVMLLKCCQWKSQQKGTITCEYKYMLRGSNLLNSWLVESILADTVLACG